MLLDPVCGVDDRHVVLDEGLRLETFGSSIHGCLEH